MDRFVGLDVSQKFAHVCAINDAGQIAWQDKCLWKPSPASSEPTRLVPRGSASKAVRYHNEARLNP